MDQYQSVYAMSLELNRAFDKSGLCEYARHLKYTVDPITEILVGSNKKSVGSVAEGTTLDDSTDTDFLDLNPNCITVGYNPLEFVSDIRTPYLRLIREPSTPAGYTKLQIYLNGEPYDKYNRIQLQSFFKHKMCISENNKCFLTNLRNFNLTTNMRDLITQNHGPALTFANMNLTFDFVTAHASEIIPNDMKSWFKRTRLNWPSKKTCDIFKTMGCYYVGVGHSISPEKDLEWRISPTKQELYLMMNLNSTQFRCYIILKMIKKYIIHRHCGDVISSYHCKTALFYTIENTNTYIWQPHYLMHCVLLCLKLLLDWVTNKNCPNYFIPEENMFENKLTDTQRKQLQTIIVCLVNTYCLNFNKTLLLKIENSGKEFVIFQTIFALKTMASCFDNDKSSLAKLIDTFDNVIKFIKTTPCDAIQAINDIVSPHQINLDILLAMFEEKLLQLNRNDHLHSVIERTYNIEKAICLPDMFTKAYQDCGYLLKLASIAATKGDYSTCDIVLQHVFKWSNRVHTLCSCKAAFQAGYTETQSEANINRAVQNNFFNYLNSYGKCINKMAIKYMLQQFTLCLQFFENEYKAGIVITPLQFDAHKTVGLPTNFIVKTDACNFNKEVVSIHPTAYLYFLQYKNSDMLNNKGDMCVAMEKLENINLINLQDWIYCHPDTTLNLLGHVYMAKGWYRLAVHCFKRSWQLVPHYNAAKWHAVFILLGYT